MLNDVPNLPFRGRMEFDRSNPSDRIKILNYDYSFERDIVERMTEPTSNFSEAVECFTGQKRTPLTHEERMRLVNAPLPSITIANRSRGHAHGHGSNPETSDAMYSNTALRRGDR